MLNFSAESTPTSLVMPLFTPHQISGGKMVTAHLVVHRAWLSSLEINGENMFKEKITF